MDSEDSVETPQPREQVDVWIASTFLIFEYAVIASLLLLAGVVTVRTFTTFLSSSGALARNVIPAVDGILVVIILLDIVHTVFRHLRNASFEIRPFLVIGILAGVRDILSASANLTIQTNLTSQAFTQTLIALGAGVGLVLALLLGLLILRFTDHPEKASFD
jgi:uncharacterized membrane protein (DUF373 family)